MGSVHGRGPRVVVHKNAKPWHGNGRVVPRPTEPTAVRQHRAHNARIPSVHGFNIKNKLFHGRVLCNLIFCYGIRFRGEVLGQLSTEFSSIGTFKALNSYNFLNNRPNDVNFFLNGTKLNILNLYMI